MLRFTLSNNSMSYVHWPILSGSKGTACHLFDIVCGVCCTATAAAGALSCGNGWARVGQAEQVREHETACVHCRCVAFWCTLLHHRIRGTATSSSSVTTGAALTGAARLAAALHIIIPGYHDRSTVASLFINLFRNNEAKIANITSLQESSFAHSLIIIIISVNKDTGTEFRKPLNFFQHWFTVSWFLPELMTGIEWCIYAARWRFWLSTPRQSRRRQSSYCCQRRKRSTCASWCQNTSTRACVSAKQTTRALKKMTWKIKKKKKKKKNNNNNSSRKLVISRYLVSNVSCAQVVALSEYKKKKKNIRKYHSIQQ